jgi:hypothetical protein
VDQLIQLNLMIPVGQLLLVNRLVQVLLGFQKNPLVLDSLVALLVQVLLAVRLAQLDPVCQQGRLGQLFLAFQQDQLDRFGLWVQLAQISLSDQLGLSAQFFHQFPLDQSHRLDLLSRWGQLAQWVLLVVRLLLGDQWVQDDRVFREDHRALVAQYDHMVQVDLPGQSVPDIGWFSQLGLAGREDLHFL